MSQVRNRNSGIYTFPIVPEIIQLKSNVDYIFGFPLGMNLFPLSFSFEPKLTVEFYVSNAFDLPKNMDVILDPYYCTAEGNLIYAERSLIDIKHVGDRFKLKFVVHVTKDHLKFVTNRLYLSLIRFPIGDWLSPGVHLFNLIQAKLLLKAMSAVHGACISSEGGNSVMLLAKPNTGKTVTIFDLVFKNNGFYLVSEDMTVVNSEAFAFSCPYTSTYFNNKAITREIGKANLIGNKDRLGLMLNRLLAHIPLLSCFGARQPTVFRLLQKMPIKASVKVKTLAFLELVRNTDGEIEAISKENALERLLAINRAEFRYYRDPLIVAFSCCNKEFDIENLLSIERRILSSLIENTEQCLIKAASPYDFAKLIRLM